MHCISDTQIHYVSDTHIRLYIRYTDTSCLRYADTLYLRYTDALRLQYTDTLYLRYKDTTCLQYTDKLHLRYKNTSCLRYTISPVHRSNGPYYRKLVTQAPLIPCVNMSTAYFCPSTLRLVRV